jgi:hypothetical protein
MDRQTIVGLFDELSKISALYDPDIHTTPKSLERIRRMEELQLQHRVRTGGVPIREVGLSDVPRLIEENPERAKAMMGGYWTEQTPKGPAVYKPKGLAEKITPATFGFGPGSRMAKPIVMHHELDEAAEMAKSMAEGKRLNMFQWGPSTGEVLRKSLPKPIQVPATKAARGIIGSLPDKAKNIARIAGQLPAPFTAMHADPRILIQESNRVARLDPAARDKMMKIRKATSEAGLLRRLGLRYGEETIPESGKRFDKLRSAMQQEADIVSTAPERFGEALKPALVGVKGKVTGIARGAGAILRKALRR